MLKKHLLVTGCREFYGKASKCFGKLLIVQCEAANANIDLLDSVRYIIQRETSDLKGKCHTVLLLGLARGIPFSGYQGKFK